MPRPKRKVVPAEDLIEVKEKIKEQMIEEGERIPDWEKCSELERTVLLCRLQTSSHKEAVRMAREMRNMDPVKDKTLYDWPHIKKERTEGFGEALTSVSSKPDEWRERILASASADILVDAVTNHQYLMNYAKSDTVRMQAVDKAYQLHGLYERSRQAAIAATAPPPVQININLWDSYKDKDGNVQKIARTTIEADATVVEESPST